MALTPVLTHNDALPRLTLVVSRGSLTLAQHDRMNVPQHDARLIATQGLAWQPLPMSPDSLATTSTTRYERSHRTPPPLSVDMTQITTSTAPYSATASRILQRKPRSYDLNEDFKRDAGVVKERNARNFTLHVHGTAFSQPELARVKIVSCVSYFS